ncbi:hypothetical protein SAMN00017405_0407 [Desulfonispora thiosulfatigenes DSM 11270]|uniref:Uncharacterized protein n=1 Tax=Desulfonispora thiosulfatigenes DSM 11270 TaxID=656914 RepID=A0A1W1VPZ4_DESTI|nr:hypothetical protein [Desulfonispora thiosulfatigenes]SMB95452.1 hypothetical protein SAMN00017405_0407 [Desulfonispora thiosulfatigenes DSM 11270]
MKNVLKKHNSELYIEAIGLNSLILLSKDLFPSNDDLKSYTDEIIKIELKNYLFKSRTLLVAKINKYIYDLEVDEIKTLYKNMNNYLINKDGKSDKDNDNNKNNRDENNKINNKKNKSKDNLKTWLENI